MLQQVGPFGISDGISRIWNSNSSIGPGRQLRAEVHEPLISLALAQVGESLADIAQDYGLSVKELRVLILFHMPF